MPAPTVSLHGSGPVNLANDHARRYYAANKAAKIFAETTPNARDYGSPEEYREARRLNDDTLAILRKVEDDALAALQAVEKTGKAGADAVMAALDAEQPKAAA